MGGSIGAGLVRRGRSVLFVDRDQEHVDAINRHGLRITGPVESFTVPARALVPEEVDGVFPLIFLCVKSQHTRDALTGLTPAVPADGSVVSIQNGLCELEIAEALGASRTVGAFVNFGADYLEPGVIHRGNRGATVVGELDGQITERARGIHEILRLFEPDAILSQNIFGFLWGKLAYASLLFATALTDDSIADVLAQETSRPALISLAREAVAVAVAKRVTLESFDGFDPGAFMPTASMERARGSMDDLVSFNRGSAKTHSGIWRDLAVRKRPTEVDAQLGWIVRIGRELGVATPLTEIVIRQIHEIESGSRSQDRANLQELRASA